MDVNMSSFILAFVLVILIFSIGIPTLIWIKEQKYPQAPRYIYPNQQLLSRMLCKFANWYYLY